MRRTLENLRQDAKLNLCKECYEKVYLCLIEPGVREMIVTRFDDWRETESVITQMVMKHQGVFKSDMWVISIGEWDDKYSEDVDRELFNKLKQWPFSKKIKYLKENELLPEACYRLLDKARKRRNNFHDHPLVYRFTEEDLDLFYKANDITTRLQSIMMFNLSDDIKRRTRSSCEKACQEFLKQMS